MPGPLISVPELADALAGPRPPHLLDARWRLGAPPDEARAAYAAGHLPGAVFVDLDADLAGPPGPGGRHPLPAAEDFAAAMRRAGVRADVPVVVYDGGDGIAAARAWWTLRYFGHPNVRVLDGGLRAWLAAGLPVRSTEPDVVTRDFSARPGGMPVLSAEDAARLARAGALLDARSGERYRGETEPVDPVAGHVPGSLSAPSPGLVDADGRLLAPALLRERFAALGVSGTLPVGAYCGSGVTAAHTVLALEVAGIPAALYVGSWSNWVADPLRPVAVGPEPG